MKKKQWIRYAAAGSCAAVLSMSLSARMEVYGASSSELYEQIVNTQGNTTTGAAKDDRYTYSVTSDGKKSAVIKPGPGVSSEIVEVVEETGAFGPKVEEVTLSESYHEEFGVYEEGISNTCFIYSNVANGGITDQPVYVDIPANVTYTMEKDGIGIPYSSGQKVGERGSYILRLTVTDQSSAFSDQIIYKTVFRFRIQEKLPKETEVEKEFYPGSQGSGIPGFIERTEPGVNMESEGLDAALSEKEKHAPQKEEKEEASLNEEGVMGEDGNINEEVLDKVINGYLGLDEDGEIAEEEEKQEISEGSGLAAWYDPDNGLYCSTLASGGKFYSDVPNGMITSNSVTLRVPKEDGADLLVYKNGEEYPYEPGNPIEEPGSYHVYPSQDLSEYDSFYGDKNRPVFHFRIAAASVNDIGMINAPEQSSIQSVVLNGETVFQASPGENRQFYQLIDDGNYEIAMNTPSGKAYAYFTRDTQAPRFSVTSEPNRVLISYYSSDAEGCRLWKNGEEYATTGLLGQISGPGEYKLEIYDGAGNTSAASFQIKFQMNIAAIMAIVLMVLLIVALLIFFKRARKEVKVR